MQSGVALISVLLLVVIVSVLSISMTRNQNFAIHQVRNGYDFSQTNLYTLGGEELARQILWQDHQESEGLDHLNEVWAEKDLYFEAVVALKSSQVYDLFVQTHELAQPNPNKPEFFILGYRVFLGKLVGKKASFFGKTCRKKSEFFWGNL